MKWIHIVAGLISIVSGFIALYSLKGGPLHRKGGTVFAYAMLVMSGTGAFMAVFFAPNLGNVMAGMLTFYLVGSGLLTVLRPVAQVRGWFVALMSTALAAGALAFGLGLGLIGHANDIPAPPAFLFGAVALLAAAGDARMLRAGRIEGTRRLSRHLWRMTFALWIATTSLFLGQAKHFPAFLRQHFELRLVPVLLVTITLFYWLLRMRVKRRSATVVPSRSDATLAQPET